jgi:hypothetical protein
MIVLSVLCTCKDSSSAVSNSQQLLHLSMPTSGRVQQTIDSEGALLPVIELPCYSAILVAPEYATFSSEAFRSFGER